jgi:alkylation response protein AidB-like acyl-CoA dehydrogenase
MYPIQLDLDADQTLFAQTCRQFLEREHPLPAVRARIDTGVEGVDRELWKRAAELGWFGLLSPAELGGGGVAGNGVADSASVAAELGRFLHPGPVIATNVVASAVAAAGSGDQRATLVPRLLEGGAVATWALGEVGWLWGDGEPSVRIGLDAGGGAVLDGTAGYVQDAAAADYLLVSGRAVAGGEDRGTVQVVVPAGTPGVVVTPLHSLDLTRGLAEVRFADVALSSASLVGDVERTPWRVAAQFDLAVVLQSAETVGAAERVFEFTLQYARDRVAFGRPIGSYQAIKHRLADLLVWLEGAKATVSAAVGALAAGSEDGSHLVSVAAAYVKDVGPRLIQECVQIHGGIGLTWEHDIHLYLRRATTNAALLGTPAAHRGRLDALLTSPPSRGGDRRPQAVRPG